MKDFEDLLEKVLAGEAGPEDIERLKKFIAENPQLTERCKAAMEAWEIIREAGRLTLARVHPIPAFPQHRKAELLVAVRQMPINTLEPLDLLKRFGRFEHAQAFGKILGYDPEIKTGRLTLKLTEWNCAEIDNETRESLGMWTKQRPGFETIVEELISAATPTLTSRYDYRKVLIDIREHLKLDGYPDESFAVIELQILTELVRLVREKLSKMSREEKDTFYKSVEAQLLKEGKTLGGVSIEEIIWASGGAGLVSVLGAEVAAGIILSSLHIGRAVLLALGLYSVPTVAIGAAIFAPIAAAIGIYFAGRHNYSKSIPCVVTLAALRQQQLDAVGSPGR